MLDFDATVQFEHDPNGKQFHGVTLRRDDNTSWVVSYQPEPWLEPFADHRVHVTGEPYTPAGQALRRPHLRLHTLTLITTTQTLDGPLLIAIGREQTLRGSFTDKVGAPGTKLAGEPYRVFTVTGGDTYLLANNPDGARPGQPQQIVAREVEYSPFVARRGGPTLWVLAIQ